MPISRFTIVADSFVFEKDAKQLSKYTVLKFNEFLEKIKNGPVSDEGYLFLLQEESLNNNLGILIPWMETLSDIIVNLVVFSKIHKEKNEFDNRIQDLISFILPENIESTLLKNVLENVFHTMYITATGNVMNGELTNVYNDLRSVTKVGQALLNERDFDTLISLILHQAREIVDADSGSMYVVEPPKVKGQKPTKLRFKKSSLNLNADEFLLDINANSIAGYVAMIGKHLIIDDVYKLTGKEEYKFNHEYDKNFNYHTKSMMLIPMKNHHEEVIGVIQLINKKLDRNRQVTVEDMKGKWVIAFNDKDYEIISALAGQAGMAIENNILIQEIRSLFEGFVKASVKAIEQRDPTTSGHSSRVAEYTESMAQVIDRISDGPFASVKFSIDQFRELRYAALLHDFGKVGVREKVLVKAKKLYPHQLDLIEWRFHYIRRTLEKEHLQKKFDLLKRDGREKFDLVEAAMETEFKENMQKLHNMFESISKANEPSIMEEGDFKMLETLTNKMVMLDNGKHVPFLDREEFLNLSVKKGTLDANERLEIESHVSHTYQFLIQIPWTTDLAGVPDIAHGHHEKLDGTGYPLGIDAPKITIQTRMMTIADIFDALTAWDRPYKKAVPYEKAIDILVDEASHGKVDKTILDVFIKSELYKKFQSSVIF
jgi:HD-GYP domain-containing protein (c-di-GMP phosphodiesterase class II)